MPAMATQAQSSGRKRTVHQLDTPYSTVEWPEISHTDQESLLELLCSLLSPMGHHRRTHGKSSKGKKAAKAGHKAKASQDQPDTAMTFNASPPPPPPELSSYVDIGLSAITRTLSIQPKDGVDSRPEDSVDDSTLPKSKPQNHYAVIFVARGDQSSAFNCHIPKMVGAASKDLSPEEKIRLVGFSKPSMEKLSKCLGIPIISSIGISRDAPGAKGLLDMVSRVVKPVEVPWLDENGEPAYLTTKINTTETTTGPKRQKAG